MPRDVVDVVDVFVLVLLLLLLPLQFVFLLPMQMPMLIMLALAMMLYPMHLMLLHMLLMMMLTPKDAKMLNIARHVAGAYASVVVANAVVVAYATGACDDVLYFHSVTRL